MEKRGRSAAPFLTAAASGRDHHYVESRPVDVRGERLTVRHSVGGDAILCKHGSAGWLIECRTRRSLIAIPVNVSTTPYCPSPPS
jgi:hypothetical protein